MRVSVLVGRMLVAAFGIAKDRGYDEVEAAHLFFALLDPTGHPADNLQSTFIREWLPAREMLPVSEQAVPSRGLEDVLAWATRNSQVSGRDYVLALDIEKALAAVGGGLVAQQAAGRAQRVSVADPRSEPEELAPDTALREILRTIAESWKQRIETELLYWLYEQGADNRDESVDFDTFLASTFGRLVASQEVVKTAISLSRDGFIALAPMTAANYQGAYLTPRGTWCVRAYGGNVLKAQDRLSSEREETVATASEDFKSKRGRNVFVVHGRNKAARFSMFEFLRAIGLAPIEWSKAVSMTGEGSPYIGEVLTTALGAAQAIVVLLTPDDVAYLRSEYANGDADPETTHFGQARPNVLFEAGMAMGRDPARTILVELGELRSFSDVAGRHVLRMNNEIGMRKQLAERLRTAGCDVDTSGEDWHVAGDFVQPPRLDEGSP